MQKIEFSGSTYLLDDSVSIDIEKMQAAKGSAFVAMFLASIAKTSEKAEKDSVKLLFSQLTEKLRADSTIQGLVAALNAEFETERETIAALGKKIGAKLSRVSKISNWVVGDLPPTANLSNIVAALGAGSIEFGEEDDGTRYLQVQVELPVSGKVEDLRRKIAGRATEYAQRANQAEFAVNIGEDGYPILTKKGVSGVGGSAVGRVTTRYCKLEYQGRVLEGDKPSVAKRLIDLGVPTDHLSKPKDGGTPYYAAWLRQLNASKMFSSFQEYNKAAGNNAELSQDGKPTS